MVKYLLFLNLVVLAGCATTKSLDQKEIEKMEIVEVDKLALDFAHDEKQLRVDLFRQTYEVYDECGSSTEEEPYHPLGFDLGNALFLDLNGNLGFRIDQILVGGMQEAEHVLQISDLRRNRLSLFQTNGVRTCSAIVRLDSLRKVRCRELIPSTDSVAVVSNGRTEYRLVNAESTARFYPRMRKNPKFKISKDIWGNYEVNRGRRSWKFTMKENRLDLGNWFVIERDTDNGEIRILVKRRGKTKLHQRIIRTGDHIVAYNDRYRGIKIQIQDDNLLYFEGKRATLKVSEIHEMSYSF